MKFKTQITGALLILAAHAQTSKPALRLELQNASIAHGLALAASTSWHVTVIPFDRPEMRFDAEGKAPVSAFSREGHMVLWRFFRGLLDSYAEFVIESKSQIVASGRPSVVPFSPISLSEASSRVSFWHTTRPMDPLRLYWSSFDGHSGGFVDEARGLPDWSPDGQALVYEKEGKIYIFNIPDNSSRTLTAGRDPTWSPNGKWIAFTAPNGRSSLVTADGAPVHWPIAEHAPLSSQQWSPDGNFVSFAEATPPSSRHAEWPVQLIVCRVTDGEQFKVREFDFDANDTQSYRWILDYRDFCKKCSPTP